MAQGLISDNPEYTYGTVYVKAGETVHGKTMTQQYIPLVRKDAILMEF